MPTPEYRPESHRDEEVVDPCAVQLSIETIAARTATIRENLLARSGHLRQPNFSAISAADLASLFQLYDQHFFGGWLGRTVAATSQLTFRLSPTMTRAGGKTITWRRRAGQQPTGYQIAIASSLLFMNFDDAQRPVVVCGVRCQDRLSALQRIMEHEIIHLVELLVFGRSKCSSDRFQSLARNIFGHTKSTHDLVTPRENASVRHGIHLGDTVEFEAQGQRHTGRVNRIHNRATILVESPEGQLYDDGKRYSKWYVPLRLLRVVP